MKETILVTGSESFVASFLIKKLKKKYNVIGVDLKKNSKNTKFCDFNCEEKEKTVYFNNGSLYNDLHKLGVMSNISLNSTIIC